MTEKRIVYLDHAATTPVKPEIIETMMPVFTEAYGNPSSVHRFGQAAKKYLEAARGQVATALNCSAREIYFTSGGTESINWAIKGMAAATARRGKHIITSAIEHHAVMHTCEWLEKQGYEVTYLPVDADGLVDAAQLEAAIRPDTVLITIMYANNEVGTIEPIEELGAIARKYKVPFHTDAVQAVGAIPINLSTLPVDMLSLSGHKLYAPKGVGVLYIRRGLRIERFMHGGAQEHTQRAGTEALPSIVALGNAVEMAVTNLQHNNARLLPLRNRLIEGIQSTIPDVKLNGHPEKRLPGNANVSIAYVEGESILLSLDIAGIAASSGSACTSGSLDPSHVLLAMGLDHATAHGSLRMTLGTETTGEDIDYVLSVLPPIITRLREMSPLYNEQKGDKIYV